ncbi:hypothetical protein [Phenylobacterium sp.]|jgi:hypothetical protein|uniref:hypothetical protein n=1 Tax=Phenylobacterium sp. TaxID=1871053 RepID=UPI002F9459A8
MPAHRRAAVAVLVLGVYLQVVEWIDLHPWNDVRTGNGQERLDLMLAPLTVMLVAWMWTSRRWAQLTASLALLLWAGLQVTTWWSPYVWGATPGWKRVHARWFADTVQVLPNDGVHLPPDANHLVLQLLIALALTLSAMATWAGFRRPAP